MPRRPSRAFVEALRERGYPLILNTGRVRDQWHTMTRTGKAPRLLSHLAEPFVEISPEDATRCGVADGAIARVESAQGAALLRVRVTERLRPGQVFAPIHWTDRFAARARIDALVAPHTDPVSGQPESKHTPVRLTPFGAAWHGYAVTRARPAPDRGLYWALAPVAGGWQVELAGERWPDDWNDFAGNLLGCDLRQAESLALHDPAAGLCRLAAFDGDRLLAALFVSRRPPTIYRSWVAAQLSAAFTPMSRLTVLAGRGGAAVADRGAILCACQDVGVNEIAAAMASGARTVAQIGAATGAGTGCGSCRAEIRGLIDGASLQAAE